MHNEIVPAVNQIETHPFYQQTEIAAFMKEQGVQHQSWAPFAEGRGKSIAQVVLRWLVQRGVVVIPKSVHKERIVENIDIFNFELSADEMEQISTLDTRESLFLSYHDPEVAKMMGNWRIEL